MQGADYTLALQKLLPPGPALPRALTAIFSTMLQVAGNEFARIEAAASSLVDELDPRTTLVLLPYWEDVCGLPDPCCGTLATTIPERRAAVLAVLTAIGGQSEAARIGRAAGLGYTITIDTFAPLRAGFHAGEPCGDAAWAYAWRTNVLGPGAIPAGDVVSAAPVELVFRAGSGRAGERLRGFASTGLECVFSREAHAHVSVIFAYPPDPVAAWAFDFTGG